tara:strand:+ start:96 stop:539 length:444 start_codon:yes stop_codon:yes gene_type:complete
MRPAPANRAAFIKGFRSGLEARIYDQLKECNCDAEYEPFKIPYVWPEQSKTYTPDFYLPNGIVIESKGIFTSDDRKKHLLIREQLPELDIRFVFHSKGTKIRKGSKTTVCAWAEKNNFMYAVKLVPEEWITEPQNEKSISIIDTLRG